MTLADYAIYLVPIVLLLFWFGRSRASTATNSAATSRMMWIASDSSIERCDNWVVLIADKAYRVCRESANLGSRLSGGGGPGGRGRPSRGRRGG